MNLFALLLLLVVLAFVLMAFLNHRLFVAALNTLERIGAPKPADPAPAAVHAPVVAAPVAAPATSGSAE